VRKEPSVEAEHELVWSHYRWCVVEPTGQACKEGYTTLRVDAETAAKVEAGCVDCHALGIHVRCDRYGRIVDAEQGK